MSTNGKVLSLRDAVARYVQPGCHISIGGFTINRNPMAAVHEIIRQGALGLHLSVCSNGQGVDELIGGGCVARVEIAYGGNGRFAPTCIRFRRAVESGALRVEDYTNYQMTLRFLAGAMGVPFLPTRSGLGSDVITRWGLSADERRHDPHLPERKVVVLDNPFGAWCEAARVVLVPALRPDVTFIHAQQAGRDGTTRINGLTFADIEQARASRHVVVTCERLVACEALRQDGDRNQLPPFAVDAVVEVPHGAYPTACHGWYDYDPEYLWAYAAAARDDQAYERHLAQHVRQLPDHAALLSLVGEQRLATIAAHAQVGYARGLDRSASGSDRG